MIRLMNGVITKKRKWATLPHYRGLLEARPIPGTIGLEPASDEIEQRIMNGQITQLRVLAQTRHPALLCRMLLKIGIETIARPLCVRTAVVHCVVFARRQSGKRSQPRKAIGFDPRADGRSRQCRQVVSRGTLKQAKLGLRSEVTNDNSLSSELCQ